MTKQKGKILFQLFINMFYISSCTFGGGFVIVSFMKKLFVDKFHWIDEDEMLDLSAIAQSSPGAIAVNASILVGWRMAGFLGVLTAILGTVLPPMIILSVIAVFYAAFSENEYIQLFLKGLQAGVAAVILNVVWDLGARVVKEKSLFSVCLMFFAFVAVFFLDVNVVIVIVAAIIIGLVRSLLFCRKEEKS